MRYKTILLLVLSAWGIMACQNYTDKIAVEIRQPVYPVLTLKEHNPVLCLRLIRNSGVAYQLEKINFTLDGTVRSGDIVSASLFLDENCGQVCASAKPVNKQLSFKVGRQIEEDTLTCWVTLRLRDDAAQATSKIEISCSSVQTDLGLVGIRQLPAVKPLRIGVALRQPGQDGVHTSRIPGLVTSTKGTLKQWHLEDMDKISRDKSVVLLDVRTVGEFNRGHMDGFKNIPVDELRERINEIEKGKPVYLICQSGLRSYIASRILEGNGYETYNFSGGFRFYDAVVNDRALIEKAYACGMDY